MCVLEPTHIPHVSKTQTFPAQIFIIIYIFNQIKDKMKPEHGFSGVEATQSQQQQSKTVIVEINVWCLEPPASSPKYVAFI